MQLMEPWKLKLDYLKIGATFGAKATGSKGRGIDYEQKVVSRLNPFVRDHMEGWRVLVGPWYQNTVTKRWRQPDIVLIHDEDKIGIVCEVKLNWAEGKDLKMLDVYLPIVKQVHELDCVWPLLITRCTRGYPHPIILKLEDLDRCMAWQQGDPTPMLLMLC